MASSTYHDRVKAIFGEALDCQSGEAREAFLRSACGADRPLRAAVDQLLAAASEGETFLEDDPIQRLGAADLDASTIGEADDGPGTVIHRYRLIRKIGEGGFGAVYLAEQREPVVREVALKIVKPGMDSRQVIARFEAERQALARMDHPHIAKVFDGGTTPSGRPYFVMEFVDGAPLTTFCVKRKLDLQQSLELFRQVCSAVQHAHQKGIIHRDIKPSNVLVGLVDGRPAPKVIDFGIAKAIEQPLTDRTLITQALQLLGTPAYMSPEQAGLKSTGADDERPDIDTRSDIYGLGVLLYELITGRPPFDSRQLLSAGLDEMRRIIREVDPPRPSTVAIQAPGDSSSPVSGDRSRRPLVSRELDWIVMKALEKDRSRRYESADALAGDVERFLAGEAVTAGPPSAAYRFQKYAQRHRTQLISAVLAALALLAGTAVSVRQAVVANQARRDEAAQRAKAERQAALAVDRANQVEEVLEFFQEKILSAPKPAGRRWRGLGADTTIREAIEAAEPILAETFKDRPLVEASIRFAIGDTYHHMGAPRKAMGQVRRALELRREHLGPEHPLSIQALGLLAVTLHNDGQLMEAIQAREEYLRLRERTLGPNDPLTLEAKHSVAWQCMAAGLRDRAVQLNEETLATCRKVFGPDHRRTLFAMQDLADVYGATERVDRAIPLQLESLSAWRRIAGPEDWETIFAQIGLAKFYALAGRHEEALALREESLALCRKHSGDTRGYTSQALHELAASYTRAGRFAEAVDLYRERVERFRLQLGAEDAETLNAMDLLAAAYGRAGQHAKEAELRAELKSLREEIAALDAPPPPGTPPPAE